MHVSQIRRALLASAAVVALGAFAPAHAGDSQVNIPIQLPLQILDPSGVCASFTPGGTPAAPTLTCVAAQPPAPGVPVCTLTASPSTIASTTQVALTATCTNTDVSTTWSWTGGSAGATGPGASPKTQNVSVSATTTFGVVATNSVGASTSKTAKVTLATGGGGGGGGGTSACSAFGRTIVMNLTYQKNAASQQFTTDGFGNNDIVVATFRTPADLTNGGFGGYLNVVESGGGPNARTVALSTTPPPTCDMSKNAEGTNVSSGSNWPKILFASTSRYGVVLQPDTQYYFYVTNRTAAGGGSCSSGNCPIAVTLQAR